MLRRKRLTGRLGGSPPRRRAAPGNRGPRATRQGATAPRAVSPKKMGQTACKPGSVPPEGGDDHSSGPAIADRFSRPTRTPRAVNPAAQKRVLRRAASLFGLAPGGACHAVPVARHAVGSYPTLSPFPAPKSRRFAFCGAIPRVAPGGSYPPPFHRGARTFLDGSITPAATARPSDEA